MDATPRFDTGGNHMGAWWGIHPPHEGVPKINQYRWKIVHPIDDGLMQENIQLKRTVDELHKRNHELIENQSKIEQKARTQQRQHDAKVYAHWKNKAEKAQELARILDFENKSLRLSKERLQEILSKLMDRFVDRSRKLIAIKRILDGSSESNSK